MRTDIQKDSSKVSMNCPFVKFCSLEKVKDIVNKYQESFTYIIHQPIDDNKIMCNGVGYIDNNKNFHSEINNIDKTTLREAMKISHHLEQKIIRSDGKNSMLEEIRKELIKNKIKGIVEFSILDDGTKIYWQIRDKY